MFIAIIAVLLIFLWWQNNCITVTKINYSTDAVPTGFDKFSVLLISDLHNKSFGEHQRKLLDLMQAQSPDIIAVTGDLIDSGRKCDITPSIEFVASAVTLAPVYFVAGNHEQKSGIYGELKSRMQNLGVTVLDDSYTTLEKNNDAISILGLRDPGFSSEQGFENALEHIAGSTGGLFKMLLVHKPEKLSLYTRYGINLVLAGHAHGGQFRLPFIGGLYAPGQGIFPKYTSGITKNKNACMVVSRGLGNSLFPFRIFNRPELVLVTFIKMG